MIEGVRDWRNMMDDCIGLSGELYSSTDLEAKKALLEIRHEINYNSYTNLVISVTA
jgi:hypothetical protein